MKYEIKIELTEAEQKRLEAIHEAIERYCPGDKLSLATVARQALTMGMDELERIYEIKRPAQIDVRDDYERHEQQSLKLRF